MHNHVFSGKHALIKRELHVYHTRALPVIAEACQPLHLIWRLRRLHAAAGPSQTVKLPRQLRVLGPHWLLAPMSALDHLATCTQPM